jgi:hypothetical protein
MCNPARVCRVCSWVMRSYDEADPIILSVDESDEVTIKTVAETIAKAFDFKGKLVVCTAQHSTAQHSAMAVLVRWSALMVCALCPVPCAV